MPSNDAIVGFLIDGSLWAARQALEKHTQMKVPVRVESRMRTAMGDLYEKYKASPQDFDQKVRKEACPFCTLHDHIALGRSLLQGIQLDLLEGGEAENFEAVAERANTALEEARGICLQIETLTSDGRVEVEQIHKHLALLLPKLQVPPGPSIVDEVLPRLDEAWRISGKLSRQFYVTPCERGACAVKLERPRGKVALELYVEQLASEVEAGSLTKAEAVQKLQKYLKGLQDKPDIYEGQYREL